MFEKARLVAFDEHHIIASTLLHDGAGRLVHVLSGPLTVTPDGGKPTTLGPGDVAVFPRGWRGPWEPHETVRKVHVVC